MIPRLADELSLPWVGAISLVARRAKGSRIVFAVGSSLLLRNDMMNLDANRLTHATPKVSALSNLGFEKFGERHRG